MPSALAHSKRTREETLIQAGQRGDLQALNVLFRRHHPSLFHSVMRVMHNREDAEDALQDGLLSAFRNLKKFEGRSQFSTWLTRIVINAALMRRRSMATRLLATSSLEPDREDETPLAERVASKSLTPEQLLGRQEILEIFRAHIEELSPALRSVFLLRIVQECTTNEAAEILSVPINTVKARLWRARHQLARRLRSTSLYRANARSIRFSGPTALPAN
jgi:RNA polymerase sigma-70 factor (ECF subfamily)